MDLKLKLIKLSRVLRIDVSRNYEDRVHHLK